MSQFFGWDLIYKLSENDIKKKEDVLTLLIHFVLIRNGYKCIGTGDDKVLHENETRTETLPSGWNISSNYSLRYVFGNDLFILRGIPVEDNLVFNFLKISNLDVKNIAFHVASTVKNLRGPLGSLVNDHEQLLSKIKLELVQPFNSEKTTQTPSVSTSVGTSQSVPAFSIQPTSSTGPETIPMWPDPERDPLRVGRRDLDPFEPGGGMIFNPFEPRRDGIPDPGAGIPGGLPRGAVPPGARFDPFGPPGLGPRPSLPRRPPDSDHFPPPGGGSMFL